MWKNIGKFYLIFLSLIAGVLFWIFVVAGAANMKDTLMNLFALVLFPIPLIFWAWLVRKLYGEQIKQFINKNFK